VTMAGQMGGIGGWGFTLLGVLFAMMFFYNVFLFMLDSNARVMVDLTKLTITWALLSALLIGWTAPMGGSGPTSSVSVSGFFLKAIPSMAEKFTGGEDPTPKIVDMHANAIMNLYKVLSPKQDSTQSISDRLVNAVPIFGFSQVVHFATGSTNTDNQPGMFSVLISVVLLLIAAFFILWSLLTFVFVLNAGTMMLYVGLGIGPMLIPFLLVPKLSFLFDGWLKFMISASLYKVIAVMVGILSIGTVDVIVRYSNSVAGAGESVIFLSLMILFFAMLGKQMMGLADNIATSLASGGVSAVGHDTHKVLMGVPSRSGLKESKEPKVEQPPKPATKGK
jgi:hypothetical protein